MRAQDNLSNYAFWFKRFERVLSVYKQHKDTLSDNDLQELQIFLLDMGHFNASFTTEELSRLEYPKSPFTVMHDHAYLRATETWAMQMLSKKYCEDNKHKNIKRTQIEEGISINPIFLGSQIFEKEIEEYCHVLNYTIPSTANWKNIQDDLNRNQGSLCNIHWIKMQQPDTDTTGPLTTNLAEVFKQTSAQIVDKIKGLHISTNEDNIKKNIVLFYIDKARFKGCDALVVIRTKHPYKLINSLGYRMDPVKAVRVLLNEYYKLLFFDTKTTMDFLNDFKKTPHFGSLAEEDRKYIKNLETPIKQLLQSKALAAITQPDIPTDIPENLSYPSINIFTTYASQYLARYNSYPKSSLIRRIADAEMKELLGEVATAAGQSNLSKVVRATQSIAEIMQLDLNLNYELNYPDIIKSQLTQAGVQVGTYIPIKHVALTSYAMRAFIRALQISDLEANKKIYVTNQAYYELLENFERLHTKTRSVSQIRHVEDIESDADIIFMELHPNNVAAITQQYAHDALKLLKNINDWNNDEEGAPKPRTIVLDVTLNALNDEEVSTILKESAILIRDGWLNLILIQSLTKFAQLGLDKRSAGCIVLINNGNCHWQTVNKKLQEITAKEPVDKSIENFFAYFANHNDLLKKYIEMVNINVRKVYQLTMAQLDKLEVIQHSRFQITVSSDPKACYVAINMSGLLPDCETKTFSMQKSDIEHFSEDLLKNLIYPLCEFHGLPISARASIGFPLTSVNAVMDSLRFTIGLESDEQLQQYADILAYTAFVLNRVRDPQVFFVKNTQDRYEWRVKFLEEKTGQYKAMTPGKDKRYEFHYEVPQAEVRSGVNKLRRVKLHNGQMKICDEMLDGGWGSNYPIIKTSVSLSQDVEFDNLPPTEKRFRAACLSEIKGGIAVKQTLSGLIMRREGNIYSTLTFSSYAVGNGSCKQATVAGNLVVADDITIKLDNIDLPMKYMPVEQKNVYLEIINYTTINLQYSMTPDGKFFIPLKSILHTPGVALHGEEITYRSSNYTCFEIDHWNEKDPILARLMRLMTMIFIKELDQTLQFKAYDACFTHFVTNINLEKAPRLFAQAVEAVTACKAIFKEFLNKEYELSSEYYSFNRGVGAPNWPSGWSGVSDASNKPLIDEALELLKQSVLPAQENIYSASIYTAISTMVLIPQSIPLTTTPNGTSSTALSLSNISTEQASCKTQIIPSKRVIAEAMNGPQSHSSKLDMTTKQSVVSSQTINH